VGGFLQLPVGPPEDPTGYELLDLRTDERAHLARHGPDPQVCDWVFDDGAFARAAAWCADPNLDVIFLQLGPLEAGEEGHWPTVVRTLREARGVAVLCMRPHVLARVALKLPDPVAGLELPVDDEALDRFVETIAP